MTPHAEDNEVPPDFPRRGGGALAGLHPKIGVRVVAGQFVAGETEDELGARYEACLDLVAQLTAYSLRKHAERSDMPLSLLLRRVRTAVIQKGWDLDSNELGWVIQKVAVGIGTEPPDLHELEVPISEQPASPPRIESIVDRATSNVARASK